MWSVLSKSSGRCAGKSFTACCKAYGLNKFAIAGGVASNSSLRRPLKKSAVNEILHFYHPSPIFCTDNAAMIVVWRAIMNISKVSGSGYADLNAVPNLKLGER